MKKIITRIASVVFAIAIILSCSITAFAAEDNLVINSDTTAKVADKINYTLNMSDCTEGIIGLQMSITYDSEYLKVNPESVKCEKLDGAIYNPNQDNLIALTWTNANSPVDFSKKAPIVSVEFEVIKGGETDISVFITDMYGNDMKYLKAYKLTTDISVNGEETAVDKTPVITSDEEFIDQNQGDFINYVDGMGELNTPNKNDHSAVKGKLVVQNQQVTEYVDVTKGADAGDSGQNNGNITIFIIIAVAIIVLAIIAVLIVRKRDNTNSDDINTDDVGNQE